MSHFHLGRRRRQQHDYRHLQYSGPHIDPLKVGAGTITIRRSPQVNIDYLWHFSLDGTPGTPIAYTFAAGDTVVENALALQLLLDGDAGLTASVVGNIITIAATTLVLTHLSYTQADETSWGVAA